METLVEKIWQQVATLTGQDIDALDAEMLLDVDLGIDSLKTMSLWNSVMSVMSDAARNLGRSRQADMMAINSLGGLSDFLVALASDADNTALTANQSAIDIKTYVSEVDPGGEALPIAHAQRLFLLSHQLVNSTSLCSMVRVKGALNLKLLQQAWQTLVDRHINLRTCFYIPQGCSSLMDIEYRLLPDCKVPALKAKALAEAGIENTFFAQLNREWDIRQWPLHEFTLNKIAKNDHVIMLANEHIISDGLSNQRMLRELLEVYAQLQTDEKTENTGLSVADYLREVNSINQYRDEDEIAEFSAYNRSLGKATCVWNPNNSIGSDRRNYFKNSVHHFSEEKTTKLLNTAKEKRYSVYSLLLSLWLRSLSSVISERDNFILQMPTSGTVYPDCELDQVIGCWAQNMALQFPAVADVGGAIESIDELLQTAIARGFDRAQTCLMADAYAQDFPLENGVIPEFALAQAQASMRANLYFPYTGRTRIEKAYANIEVADYRAGTCNVAGTIDVLQEIHQGQLTLFANYDSLNFKPEQITQLVDEYINQIDQWLAQQNSDKKIASLVAPTATHNWQQFVLEQAQQILTVAVSADDINRDLESEVGVDSLERIRLATKISKSLNNKTISRQLIRCRSLQEIISLLSNNLPSNAATAEKKSAIKTIAKNTATKSFPALDSSLGLIPLRHIEQQAELNPQVEAVCNATESINYLQLNERANQLANLLITQGVKPGDRISMLCRRGSNMLTAIVAILKAGAAYVPLDPDFPEQRIEYIINHARVSFLIGESKLLAEKTNSIALPDSLKGIAQIDKAPIVRPLKAIKANWFGASDWEKQATQNPNVNIDPDDLMVVLYTSGSTGKPKGVALNHQGYFNRLNWHQNEFQLQVGERVAQKTSCCFDVSVWELLWPLMVGGTVCAVEKDVVTNPWELADWIKAQKIAVMHFVPSMFTEFTFAAATEKLELPDLRWLIFSGEALPVATVNAWIDTQGLDIQLANLYGPTEASIDVTSHIIRTRPAENAARISIGAAIDNTVMLILDDNNQRITAQDQMGDLYIAGIQLAKGYLFDEEKTAAAFIPNPFADVPGEFIYKTGDIASWLPNNEIDYRGRKDSQVKLRGFRIELGEIESVLTGHCGAIEAAALVVDVNGQQKLLACYSPANLVASTVKKLASEKLTEYMLPHILLGVDSLPKNHNGKLDRNIVRELFEQGKLHTSNANEVAVQYAKDAQKEEPTKPALIVSQATNTSVLHTGLSYGLTPAQLGLVQSVAAPYQRASCTRMRYQGHLDTDLFCKALNIQFNRHDALRSIFIQKNNCWQRAEITNANYEPQFFDARGLTEEEFDNNFCQLLQAAADALRIDTWPLMQIMLVRVERELYEIGIVCHQIIGDMVTGNLMCQQLWQIYDQLANQQDVNGETIPSGLDLAQRLQQKEQEQTRAALINYWQQEFSQAQWPFALAHSKKANSNSFGSQLNLRRELNAEDSQQLLNGLHQKLGVCTYSLFAGPLYKTLGDIAQQERVVVSHRFNGRNAIRERIYFESIDGFAIQFPIALQLGSEQSLAKIAQDFEKKLGAVPWRGASYDWVGMELPNHCYPESRVTAVRMNFLGDMTRPENSKIQLITGKNNLRMVPEHHIRPIDLEIWVMIKDGKVGVEVGYSSQQFHEHDIAKLLETYLNELRQLAHSIVSNSTFTKENRNVAA